MHTTHPAPLLINDSKLLLQNTIHEVPGYEIFYNFLFASIAENYHVLLHDYLK